MVPTWVGTLLVLLAGCFLAYFIGATLPDYDVEIHGVNMQIYIVIVALVCVIAAVTNNFPVLLAIGLWMPFVLPLGMFSAFPTVVLVLIWMAVILFFPFVPHRNFTLREIFQSLLSNRICLGSHPVPNESDS